MTDRLNANCIFVSLCVCVWVMPMIFFFFFLCNPIHNGVTMVCHTQHTMPYYIVEWFLRQNCSIVSQPQPKHWAWPQRANEFRLLESSPTFRYYLSLSSLWLLLVWGFFVFYQHLRSMDRCDDKRESNQLPTFYDSFLLLVLSALTPRRHGMGLMGR